MQPTLKRTIATIVGIAAIPAVVLLAFLMMPRATPEVDISQPLSQEIANVPDGSGMDEASHAVATADPNESQLFPRRELTSSRKLDAARNPQEALSTLAAENNTGTESLASANQALDAVPLDDNTTVGVAPSREALENREVAVNESSADQAVTPYASAQPSGAAEEHVSTYLSGRASELLAEIQQEGNGLLLHAETLGTFSRNPQFSWQSHAHYLDRVKGHINAVGERTAELQRIRNAVLPWQQQAITDVTSHAEQVAASTNAAIVHLRENQNRLFVSEYRDHLSTIEDRAGDMKQTVDKFLDYEKTQQKFQQLHNELELSGD